jgi:hypothetical protein
MQHKFFFLPVDVSSFIVSHHMSNAKPSKQTNALIKCLFVYVAWRKKVDNNIIQGIDQEDNTSADNTDVFLNASTANTLPKIIVQKCQRNHCCSFWITLNISQWKSQD